MSASCHVSIHPFLCGVADSGVGKSRLQRPVLPELQRVEVGVYNISHGQGANLGWMLSPLPHHVESSEANAGQPRLEYCFLQVVSELTASCELQAGNVDSWLAAASLRRRAPPPPPPWLPASCPGLVF